MAKTYDEQLADALQNVRVRQAVADVVWLSGRPIVDRVRSIVGGAIAAHVVSVGGKALTDAIGAEARKRFDAAKAASDKATAAREAKQAAPKVKASKVKASAATGEQLTA